MKRFKNIGFFMALAGATVLTTLSCNRAPQADLETLIARRDSIQQIRGMLEDEIIKLDAMIQRLDTTLRYKKVTVIEADTSLFKRYFDIYGNVKSDHTASLYAESPGNITAIQVKEGQHVKKGQVLVRIDDVIFDRNLAELETNLELATTVFEKQQRLWNQNIGSELEYLEAKNRKESLENARATLKEQRNKASIVAPFDGVVDKIFQNVGEMASGQVPVLRLVNLSDLYITADVSERYINSLHLGDEVVMSFGGDTVTSRISRIGNFVNPANRSFEIQVDLHDELKGLRPNSLVALKINDLTKEGAIVLPSSIVMQDSQGQDYVYVVEEDDSAHPSAVKRIVETGASYQGKTVINQGVLRGDVLINEGSRSVRDSEKINIAQEAAI